MQIIKTAEEITSLTDNKIIGAENLTMQNSEIRFGGSNNILFVEENVTLYNSLIDFKFNNCVVYLSSSSHVYWLNLSLNNDSACFIGKNNFMNGILNIVISEHKHVVIGGDGLFAFGIWIRTADPHLVYSAITKKRLNFSKSVFVGDHVWLGQNVFLLKGTHISSGSIIGAGAVCPGRKIASNESWAGNPAVCIAKDIFWDRKSVHAYTEEDTKKSETFSDDRFVFRRKDGNSDVFNEIDTELTNRKSAEDKLEYLKELSNDGSKNRFASGGNTSGAVKRKINNIVRGK